MTPGQFGAFKIATSDSLDITERKQAEEALREAHPDLPVVIVAGYPGSELMQQARQYAPVTLLAKPVDARLLERTVCSVLLEKMASISHE
jgi:DNA-binding NarL/FixJ family response regulator